MFFINYQKPISILSRLQKLRLTKLLFLSFSGPYVLSKLNKVERVRAWERPRGTQPHTLISFKVFVRDQTLRITVATIERNQSKEKRKR